MKENIAPGAPNPFSSADWFDPLEDAVHYHVRSFIESVVEEELTAALGGRARYQRKGFSKGSRNGHRDRQLIGSFGPVTLSLPRGRLIDDRGIETEWKSKTIPAFKRVTKRAEAIIAGAYLGGTNTRRVRRALSSLFGGRISKDTVSRAWRKVKTDWEDWNNRDLSKEKVVRLILDGTAVKVRLDKRATVISLLVVLGIRHDGQKILLSIKNMGGESEEA